jgi:hypothetical protein
MFHSIKCAAIAGRSTKNECPFYREVSLKQDHMLTIKGFIEKADEKLGKQTLPIWHLSWRAGNYLRWNIVVGIQRWL